MSETPRPRDQPARRARTRAKIVDAARTLFAEEGYTAVSVDRIAAAAGIGRATFYTHFTGKGALVETLYETFRAGLIEVFASLESDMSLDQATVRNWVRRYIAFLVSESGTVRALSSAHLSGFGALLGRANWHALVLDALGSRFAAFRVAATGHEPTMTARAHLLIFQLEGFATACALEGWQGDIEATIILLARSLAEFVEDGARISA